VKCTERVAAAGGYQFHQCERDAVEDGLCRMHLAAKRKRDANFERKRAERAAKHALSDARADVIDAAKDLAQFDVSEGREVPESYLDAIRSTVRVLLAAEEQS